MLLPFLLHKHIGIEAIKLEWKAVNIFSYTTLQYYCTIHKIMHSNYNSITLLLLLLTGTIFSYFCMSSINFSYFDSNCSILMIFIVIDDIIF